MNKLCLLLLCYVILFKANSQPGSLDSTFGNNGIQTTAFPNNLNYSDEQGSVVLTSANGDFFVVVNVNYHFTRIAKYLPDGRLDSSYGSAGYTNAVNLMFNRAAVMQGDKIIVAGSISNADYTTDFALARYTANGVLDASFGVNGIVTTDFSDDDEARSITLQRDKIIVAGYTFSNATENEDFALARYTADGVLDSSFGENGKVLTDFNNLYDYATSIALQGEKIIVGGSALLRYTADGILDSSFGESGKATTDFSASSIAIQKDKIIVAG